MALTSGVADTFKNVNSTGAILTGTLYIDSLRNARGPYHIFFVGGRALTFCPCHQVILKVKSDGYKMWSHGERDRERDAGCSPQSLWKQTFHRGQVVRLKSCIL